MRNGDVRVWCWLLLCAWMPCTVLSPSCDLGKQPDLHPLQAVWPPQLLPSSGGGRRGVGELLALELSFLALLPLG